MNNDIEYGGLRSVHDTISNANSKDDKITRLQARVAELEKGILAHSDKLEAASRDYDAYCADLGCASIMEVADKFKSLQRDCDSLRKALDDRHESDKRAWKAIMQAAARERGLPDNKEVVAYYVAENERLENERDAAQIELKRLFPISKYDGLDIEQWKAKAAAAGAEVRALREALMFYGNINSYVGCDERGDPVDSAISRDEGDKARAALSATANSETKPMSTTIKDAALREAEGVIENLQALIRGECPSLFDEDSGGKPQDDMDCDAALASIRKALSSGTATSNAPDGWAIAEKLAEALDNATSRVRMNDSDGAQVSIDNYHLKNGRAALSEFERAKGNANAIE